MTRSNSNASLKRAWLLALLLLLVVLAAGSLSGPLLALKRNAISRSDAKEVRELANELHSIDTSAMMHLGRFAERARPMIIAPWPPSLTVENISTDERRLVQNYILENGCAVLPSEISSSVAEFWLAYRRLPVDGAELAAFLGVRYAKERGIEVDELLADVRSGFVRFGAGTAGRWLIPGVNPATGSFFAGFGNCEQQPFSMQVGPFGAEACPGSKLTLPSGTNGKRSLLKFWRFHCIVRGDPPKRVLSDYYVEIDLQTKKQADM